MQGRVYLFCFLMCICCLVFGVVFLEKKTIPTVDNVVVERVQFKYKLYRIETEDAICYKSTNALSCYPKLGVNTCQNM